MKINVLDQVTIDKIAAGEVVERPASVVKELIENSIDAGASSIIIEISDGGISYIRITDNGTGIEEDDIKRAFLRHTTSKIQDENDLSSIHTLGFRGEALSSIAAVSMLEVLTKTKNVDYGISYKINGGIPEELSQTGAPDGTTFIVRQLFYNTPARRKFLKTAITEASHIGEIVTKICLSNPSISIHFINNNQTKIHTSGNGKLKDVIYQIYGREIATNLLEVDYTTKGLHITGLIGKPMISKGNRSYENFYVNGRYIKSNILSKSTEDVYKDYSMQHRYPFVVLSLNVDSHDMDVNVHPTKMEVRFLNTQKIYNELYEALNEALKEKELIPQIEIPMPTIISEPDNTPPQKENRDLNFYMEEMKKRVTEYHKEPSVKEEGSANEESSIKAEASIKEAPKDYQINLFEDKLISTEAKQEYRIIGQLFETYWLIEYKENLYIIDQHAAHERVLYDKTIAEMKSREYTTQMVSPPIILDLSMKEANLLKSHINTFEKIGFIIEAFGQDSFSVSGVPDNLFKVAKKELLMDMIDSLSDEFDKKVNEDIIDEKIASLSCKAAVKGNSHLSMKEVDALISELLTIENPYHCPHGRPTIIAMSKYELEKKFKRIV